MRCGRGDGVPGSGFRVPGSAFVVPGAGGSRFGFGVPADISAVNAKWNLEHRNSELRTIGTRNL